MIDPNGYFAHNSRSFWFAAAFMSRAERDRIARVYAWCRHVDDLVDLDADAARAETRLDAWMQRSRRAYQGEPSGITWLDDLMGEMAARRIPLRYAEELARGVRMDARPRPFFAVGELHSYAHLVAGVVGQWLTEMHGVRDAWMLERAATLGRAMQISNILRDVGEDWDRGRLYLPLALLRQQGLRPHDIGELRHGAGEKSWAYRALLEELMQVAARDYARAREAMPFLPAGFRRAVSVAAVVYEGLHDAIRRNGYDNLTRRAVVRLPRKLTLAASVLGGFLKPDESAREALVQAVEHE